MKTAVITGGTRGIGASLAKDFLGMGWNAAWSGKTEISVERSLSAVSGKYGKEKYLILKCDVTRLEDLTSLWNKACEKFGKIDIWVNNAGISSDQTLFHLLDPEVITNIIDTNVKGLMLATHVAYNGMLKQGSGAIYNMEGLGSDGRSIPGLTPYGTSKRAVRYFTDAFAKEVKNGPVIVGTISPGMVLTDMTLGQLRKDPDKNRELKKIYNILANDPETITPFLVKKMIQNRKNGVKISWLTPGKIMTRFMLAPLLRRDIVSRHLDG